MSTQTPTRKLVYYIGTSFDGYIARENGSVEGFPMEGQHAADFMSSLNDYDTVLMGKDTYEWGFQFGAEPGRPSPVSPTMMHYIFSRSMENYQHPLVQVVREDAAEFVQQLKQQSGKSIWLCGGGRLAGSLLDRELIDELIITLYPVNFGSGISVFGASQKAFALCLHSAKTYNNGAVFLHYAIRY